MSLEPSTHRMRADEVRALIRMLEPQPPPDADIHGESEREATREREPPTLLYRRSSRRSIQDEPRTKRGLGLGFFSAQETTARSLSRVDAGAWSAHESAVVSGPEVERARVPASERVRRARRRSLLFCGVIVALIAVAPVLMAVVRRAAGPDAPASAAHLVRGAEEETEAARVTQALGAATQVRTDGVRRATELLMDGDSAGALSAFRELSRAHPEHFALGHVVRSLEAQIRACARGEDDGEACR